MESEPPPLSQHQDHLQVELLKKIPKSNHFFKYHTDSITTLITNHFSATELSDLDVWEGVCQL